MNEANIPESSAGRWFWLPWVTTRSWKQEKGKRLSVPRVCSLQTWDYGNRKMKGPSVAQLIWANSALPVWVSHFRVSEATEPHNPQLMSICNNTQHTRENSNRRNNVESQKMEEEKKKSTRKEFLCCQSPVELIKMCLLEANSVSLYSALQIYQNQISLAPIYPLAWYLVIDQSTISILLWVRSCASHPPQCAHPSLPI